MARTELKTFYFLGRVSLLPIRRDLQSLQPWFSWALIFTAGESWGEKDSRLKKSRGGGEGDQVLYKL